MTEITAEAPRTVECYITKKSIKVEDARQVEYMAGKLVWVHRRFVEGEAESGQAAANGPTESDRPTETP